MDNAKQFSYYPVALLKGVDNFSNGTISVKFKTIAGDADRCSGILFNVKPNGDWLAVRYNDTENNIALWEFHNGIRRPVKFSDRAKPFMLDRNAWHELKMTTDGASFKAWIDGQLGLDITLGSEPGPGAMARRRILTCSRRTIRFCVRRLRGGLGSGPRPTAPASSRTTKFLLPNRTLKPLELAASQDAAFFVFVAFCFQSVTG